MAPVCNSTNNLRHSGQFLPGALPDTMALLSAFESGHKTARAALEDCLEKIEAYNGDINAVVHLDSAGARQTADICDKDRKMGRRRGSLHGVPVSVKECFDWKNHPTTWGDPSRQDSIAKHDSVVVQRLKNAGAVIVGKTNIPAYLGDWETHNPLFGSTRNPHDLNLSAGGSSGGSAAAVATGMSYADIGSDMGGSIRLPAHYCGVSGLKPSWGLIPLRGHSPTGEIREPDIGVAGPITRSARDTDYFLSSLIGPTDELSTWRLSLPPARKRAVQELRIAAMLSNPECPVDEAYRVQLQRMIDSLRAANVKVDTTARPNIDLTRHTELMNLLVRAETSTLNALKAGTKHRPELNMDSSTNTAAGYEALNNKGASVSHVNWLHLHEERLQFHRQWAQFFETIDILLCPVAASAAPPFQLFDTVTDRTVPVNGVLLPVLAQHFWFSFGSLGGLPAMSTPIGRTEDNRPVGVQVVGKRFSDHDVTAAAHAISEIVRSVR